MQATPPAREIITAERDDKSSNRGAAPVHKGTPARTARKGGEHGGSSSGSRSSRD